jgi:hypothetical protein
VRDVHGALLPLGEPLVIEDLGRGGFAVQSPFEFLPDTEHTFGFCLPGGRRLQLRAVAVHCDRVNEPGASARYRAGFMFSLVEPADDLLVAVLADAAKGVLPRQSAANFSTH